MPYLRAHVDPIRKHFDPIASIAGNEIIVAHGLATNDLMRLKSHLTNLNNYGLLLVDRRNNNLRFLKFDKTVTGIYPSFREAAETLGLSIGFDFQLTDISLKNDYGDLSRWITLRGEERLRAEDLRRAILSRLETSTLPQLLGSQAIDVVEELMWESHVFEPLHAITIMAKASLKNDDLSVVINNLRSIRADLPFMAASEKRILHRKKSNITLMDCAKFLFTGNNYVERDMSEIAKILEMPIDRLSSHFRGYLIVDDEYVRRLFEVEKKLAT